MIGNLTAQTENSDYPSWFIDPADDDYVIGLSKNFSEKSISLKNAYLDAMAISIFTTQGNIQTRQISYLHHIADSLEIELGSQFRLPKNIKLRESAIVADLYIGLFEFNWEDGENSDSSQSNLQPQINAVGKQTLHPDRIYESWASAEIEALKELARISTATISSIEKKTGKKYEKLIYTQSRARLNRAKITRRWIKNNVCHVQVSENI
ncbi:MAG: hypothetical protein ISR95_02955 [Candidatus Marinimicrobia bacterium]|nr:hypothetical protein [Candidatus Brocadiales bacterium]MBL7046579.1 hypothetical protein [Candidatus Neomarinimicrobiota bacterium]